MAKSKEQERAEQRTIELLGQLGGQKVQDDSLVFEGDKVILPASYQGNIASAVQFLEEWDEEQNNEFNITRKFNYHPYDVAASFQRVLKEVFGTTGFGQSTWSFFFGEQKPEFRTVNLEDGKTVQVPWGHFKLPMLAATFIIGAAPDRNGQPVGELTAVAPKRYRAQIDGVFKAVGDDLTKHSMFRGKAIDANWMEPEFLDLSGAREDKVAYSADTMQQLQANVWTVLEHSEEVRAAGMQLKRAVLLEGPYGTGKSLTGYLTARKAIENGWTFIYCRPGQSLEQALHAARLLAPAVVFFEDLDVVAEPGTAGESDRISKLLDTFDGISNKTTPVVAVLTTNHVERLHKGMLRPGRLDAIVHIGDLDTEGVAKLVRSVLPEHLRGDIDFEAVFDAMKGFLPAFVKEATERALRYSIARTGGKPDQVTTGDLVASAGGLRPQLDLMTGASEKSEPVALEAALGDVVDRRVFKQVHHTRLENTDDGFRLVLPAAAENRGN